MATTMATVRFDGVTKRFPGVVALDDVTFDIAAGSCHALCGENGAGKSTLGKLLAGIYSARRGARPHRRRARPVRQPDRRLEVGRGHGPSGALVLREPVGGREPLPRQPAVEPRLRLEARDAPTRGSDAGAHRRRARRHAHGRRPDHRPAADAPDRVGDRAGGAADRLRRADEQPVAARSRAPVRDHRPAAGARRDVHLRQPSPRRDLSPLRHHHGAARRPARGDASRRRGRSGRASSR